MDCLTSKLNNFLDELSSAVEIKMIVVDGEVTDDSRELVDNELLNYLTLGGIDNE